MEEVVGAERELLAGYKLVPWSSWDQWNFVRENIFSSSAESISAALGRISGWRSRGCLPIPIDVTAAFVEIQQQDPFFRYFIRKGTIDSASVSEEVLAMLYSMAIMRLVNGFMENAHKKTGRSISELAEAAGIPRVLVDIRHESSHRDLPSLRLLRSASIKAIDWLKVNYWEPQKNAIPDVYKEIRSKVRAMLYYIKTKETKRALTETKVKRVGRPILLVGNKLSSQIIGKTQSASRSTHSDAGFERLITKAVKAISKLYSAYPSEVVSVLLEFFKLDGPDYSNSADEDLLEKYDSDGLKPLLVSFNDMKDIITKLSSKEPRLVLSMLKTIIEMIEAKQSLKGDECSHSEKSKPFSESPLTSNLSSLFLWLITTLKVLQETGNISIVSDVALPSSDKNSVPTFCLSKLLKRCLRLTIFGEKNIVNSVLMLLDMVESHTVKDKLKKFLSLGSENSFTEEIAFSNHKTMPLEHENSIKKATEEHENLKLKSKMHRIKNSDQGDNNAWTVRKAWIPCPIGMIPCSFSSTAVLPSLYLGTSRTLEVKQTLKENKEPLYNEKHKRNETQCVDEPVENERAVKKPRQSLHSCQVELLEVKYPMKGMLLIDGIWKKVSEEDLTLLNLVLELLKDPMLYNINRVDIFKMK
ncbi:hypothetical protein LUZ62_032492 [Rhynchospora pubera]|uniref:Ribosomal biogenesis protein LAS1L n=1 Tax=Rhynchospora pubera TaxID=906938 RepID=A0AAV8HWV5_9POAL|nr:hypothetical protein LUZ62_032492 [Rhynchospora pubera]